MSEDQPSAQPVELAGWKARLLDRIEDLAQQRRLLVDDGYPVYRQGDGRGAAALEGWRSRLRDLDAIRGELEIRAEIAGVPVDLIDSAREAGERSVHWSSWPSSPIVVGEDDPGRAPLLDAIAQDMWSLEQMAAVAAVYEQRCRAHEGLAPDPQTQWQYRQNMTALWARLNTNAAVAELTAAERIQWWHREQSGWIALLSRTVYAATYPELKECWRAYAWPGIQWDADRTHATQTPTPGNRPVPEGPAPSPAELTDHATRALQAHLTQRQSWDESVVREQDPEYPEFAGAPVGIETHGWDSEPTSEPGMQSAEYDSAPGLER